MAAFEYAFLVAAFMVFCGVTSAGIDSAPGSTSSNPINFAGNAIILSVVSALIVLHWRETIVLAPRCYLLGLFVLICIASVSWAVIPPVVARKVGAFMVPVLTAFYMAIRFDMTKSIRLMGHALLIVGIASLIVAVAFPSIGVMHGTPGGGLDPTESKLEGAWQGVLVHKNTLGWISICGSQVYAWRFLNEKPQRWKHGAVILLFVFLGIKCHSATALVSIIAGFLLLPALRVRHWSGVPRLWVESLLVLAVILLTVVVSLDLQNAAAIVGKDVTLTGRIPLWEVLIDSIKARPWLGYGYSGFWLDPNPEAQRVWALVHWKPPQAHNAYIDAALEVGIPGAIVATLLMFNVIRKSLRLCTDRYLVWATYVALFSILFAVTNLVETRLFRPGDNYCFMLALCYFALVKETHTRKLHERITKMKTRRALTGAFRLGEDPEQLAADEVR